jgi:GTP 3',8-cyclase
MGAYFRGSGYVLRFIEYMDVGTTNGRRLDHVVPAADHSADRRAMAPRTAPGQLSRRGRNRLPLPGRRGRDRHRRLGHPAVLPQLHARPALSRGKLYTCLFAGSGHDLRATLRSGLSDQALREQSAGIWTTRTDRYSGLRTRATSRTQKVEISHIGG